MNLIKGQLLGALTGNLFKADILMAKIFQRQAVHIVTGSNRIENIGFQHGIELHTAQLNTVVSQYVHIVFHMLADFFMCLAFQNWLQLR